MPSKKSEILDVAIVGGGISGIYAGWRLATADAGASKKLRGRKHASKKLSVQVFEGSDRIGGRLLSAQSAHAAETVCEAGGMRYVSAQTWIRSLIENELKLPRFPQIVDLPQNIAYLRGWQLRGSQTTDASLLPYDLAWAEQQFLAEPKRSPNDLIGWAVAKLLPGVNVLTGEALDKYLQQAEVDGTPLYKHGFWNLLARAMTTEALALAKATIGYDSLGANANAVDMISEYFNFTPDVNYYLLDDGYDAVPWTLQERFVAAGGVVTPNAWLEGFDAATLPDGSQGVTLQFRSGHPSVMARAVVLAMPPRSIRLLAQRGPVLDPQKAPDVQVLLDSVEPIPLYKLFLVYPYAWWSAVGVSEGRSLTDIPVHQCYYWPSGPNGTMLKDGPGIIMAYNDQADVGFWGGLGAAARVARKTGAKARMYPRATANVAAAVNPFTARLRKNWHEHEAPYEMAAEMHRQLVLMHNVQFAPSPIDAAFMDWSADPFGGGVHFWNIGYKSWEVLHQMTQPKPDFPCYVCGEAWSTNQTWVEGALQTAEIMLQKHFGLPKPPWVTEPVAAAAQAAGAR